VEIGLGLLEAQLSYCLLLGIGRDERTDRKLGECYRCDHRFSRERRHVGNSFEKDNGAGVKNTAH
jgi:hypothetical protein